MYLTYHVWNTPSFRPLNTTQARLPLLVGPLGRTGGPRKASSAACAKTSSLSSKSVISLSDSSPSRYNSAASEISRISNDCESIKVTYQLFLSSFLDGCQTTRARQSKTHNIPVIS